MYGQLKRSVPRSGGAYFGPGAAYITPYYAWFAISVLRIPVRRRQSLIDRRTGRFAEKQKSHGSHRATWPPPNSRHGMFADRGWQATIAWRLEATDLVSRQGEMTAEVYGDHAVSG